MTIPKPSAYLGLDPSYAGFGFCLINSLNKTIRFRIFSQSGDYSYRTYYHHSSILAGNVCSSIDTDASLVIGLETPPPVGQMAPALYGLSFRLVSSLVGFTEGDKSGIHLFNPTYLGFLLHKKKYSRQEVCTYAIPLLREMVEDGYELLDGDKYVDPDARIKNDKIVAFLFALRLFIRYHTSQLPLSALLNREPVDYSKLLEEKEAILG